MVLDLHKFRIRIHPCVRLRVDNLKDVVTDKRTGFQL